MKNLFFPAGLQADQPNLGHSNLIQQETEADPYSWAYKVTTGDHNYTDRHDKKFDLLDYDWDQNRQLEAWFLDLCKDPNLHK